MARSLGRFVFLRLSLRMQRRSNEQCHNHLYVSSLLVIAAVTFSFRFVVNSHVCG